MLEVTAQEKRSSNMDVNPVHTGICLQCFEPKQTVNLKMCTLTAGMSNIVPQGPLSCSFSHLSPNPRIRQPWHTGSNCCFSLIHFTDCVCIVKCFDSSLWDLFVLMDPLTFQTLVSLLMNWFKSKSFCAVLIDQSSQRYDFHHWALGNGRCPWFWIQHQHCCCLSWWN